MPFNFDSVAVKLYLALGNDIFCQKLTNCLNSQIFVVAYRPVFRACFLKIEENHNFKHINSEN